MERKKKRLMFTRKSILCTTFAIVFGCMVLSGLLMSALSESEVMIQAFKTYHIDASMVMILFTLMVLVLWLPLLVGNQQVYDLDEQGLTLIPILKQRDKWKIIFYVLCNDQVEPFLRKVSYEDIKTGIFYVERKFGSWSFSRYTYVLKLSLSQSNLLLYINPMDNGPLMPSGKGGFALVGYRTSKDICNMLQFLMTRGIPIDDPYQLIPALQNPTIEIYDFLETLPIKTKY